MRGRRSGRLAPDVEAVVFDFDGLLMDTESTSLASWRYEWAQWGLALDENRFFVDHGGDVTEQRYAELAAAVGPAYDQRHSHTRRTAYRDRLHRDLTLMPGTAQWINDAGTGGVRLAVASSSPTRWVIAHLTRAAVLGRFDVLACGDEVTAHKPAPDVYLLALERLGVAPARAVAVEDTAHGVTAARAAGMRCVAIPNPFVDPARLAHADLVVGSAAEIDFTEMLTRLRRRPSSV